MGLRFSVSYTDGEFASLSIVQCKIPHSRLGDLGPVFVGALVCVSLSPAVISKAQTRDRENEKRDETDETRGERTFESEIRVLVLFTLKPETSPPRRDRGGQICLRRRRQQVTGIMVRFEVQLLEDG